MAAVLRLCQPSCFMVIVCAGRQDRIQLLASAVYSMMGDTQDLEELCEDATFEVCDARERYPLQCAEELDKYLSLKNDMAMRPVVLKHIPLHFEIPPKVDTGRIRTPEENDSLSNTWRKRAKHLQSMTDKVQDLKVAFKQLENNKNFELKHHLQ